MTTKQGVIEVKKSKFYYYRYDGDMAGFDALLSQIKSEHKKATHVVYAYSFSQPFNEKCCDDGEPKSTAGAPILSVIQKKKLSNVAVIVV